jgi:hypothetical protein
MRLAKDFREMWNPALAEAGGALFVCTCDSKQVNKELIPLK